MKTVTLNEKERGLLYRNGKLTEVFAAGKHRVWGSQTLETLPLEKQIESAQCPVETLLKNGAFAAQTVTQTLADQQMMIHFVNGRVNSFHREAGLYAFWRDAGEHTFQVLDCCSPEVGDVPQYVFEKMPRYMYTCIAIEEYETGLLYFDQKFVRTLGPGKHYFWNMGVNVWADRVDLRLQQMDITGQEIMTQDKVTLRVNMVCNYRVTDAVRMRHEIGDAKEQLHVAAQLGLRDFVGRYKLDDLLQSKEEMSRFVLEQVQQKAKELYLDVSFAGVKDIILPGEIREIMNTVLVAEKRAQANVITRREEVASTRSLLNTAKLMDENQTLYKLKELEYLERICEHVGSIQLNSSADVLSQLSGLLHGNSK